MGIYIYMSVNCTILSTSLHENFHNKMLGGREKYNYNCNLWYWQSNTLFPSTRHAVLHGG